MIDLEGVIFDNGGAKVKEAEVCLHLKLKGWGGHKVESLEAHCLNGSNSDNARGKEQW